MAGIRPGRAAAGLLAGALLLSGCGGSSGADSSADRETGPGRFPDPPINVCKALDPAPFTADYGTPKPGEDHLLDTVRDCSFEFPARMGAAAPFLNLFADFRPSVEDARTEFDRTRDRPSDKPVSEQATVKKVGDAAFAYQEEPNDHEVRSTLVVRRSNLVVTVYLDETAYSLGLDRSKAHRDTVRQQLATYVTAALAKLAAPR